MLAERATNRRCCCCWCCRLTWSRSVAGSATHRRLGADHHSKPPTTSGHPHPHHDHHNHVFPKRCLARQPKRACRLDNPTLPCALKGRDGTMRAQQLAPAAGSCRCRCKRHGLGGITPPLTCHGNYSTGLKAILVYSIVRWERFSRLTSCIPSELHLRRLLRELARRTVRCAACAPVCQSSSAHSNKGGALIRFFFSLSLFEEYHYNRDSTRIRKRRRDIYALVRVAWPRLGGIQCRQTMTYMHLGHPCGFPALKAPLDTTLIQRNKTAKLIRLLFTQLSFLAANCLFPLV